MSKKRYAVLFGCGNYETLEPLRCPVNDVRRTAEVLGRPDVGGFEKVMCIEENTPSYAIMEQLEGLITSELDPDDALLFYFSGHGKQDRSGQLYLATHGTKETALDSTSLSFARIMDYVGRSRCKSVLTILDCCYSGAVKNYFAKGSIEDAFTAAGHEKGAFILTSSTETQQSMEKEGDELSIFTKYLIEGIESGHADLDNDGLITFTEAHRYTFANLAGFGFQRPQKFAMSAEGDFLIARNPNYVPLDPSKLDAQGYMRFFAIKTMVEMLKTERPPIFMVVLVPGTAYRIEGEEYRATALTVTNDHTPNVRLVNDGFECDAFFPPQLLTERAKEGKEAHNGVYKVDLFLPLANIMLILGKRDGGAGEQIQLYPGSAPGVSLT